MLKKSPGKLKTILLFLTFSFIFPTFLSSKAYASESTYNFSTCSQGSNCWAYEKGDAQPTNPTNYNSQAETGDYTAISSSNNARWVTQLADADGEYDSHIYTFTVSESESIISQLDVNWEGYGETESAYSTYLKIWNDNTSSWEQLDSHDFTTTTDDTLTGAKSSSISNYVDSNSKVHILVSTKKHYVDPMCNSCTCSGSGYQTITCDGDTVYVDCTNDKCWSPTAGSMYTWGGYDVDEPTNSCVGIANRPACNYCDNLNYGGKTDWVLPERDTLLNLCNSGSCSGTCFGGDGSWQYNWSATEYSRYEARVVYFNHCSTSNAGKQEDFIYIRCVRSGLSLHTDYIKFLVTSGNTVSTPPTDTTIYTSSDWGTDVSSSGQTGTVEVGAVDSTSNKRVATFDLDFSANIDLASLTIDSNPTAGKAVFHYPGGFSSIPGHTSSGGQSGTYTLYVPKGQGNKVCICPNATCLSEVNATCTGRYCKDETYNNVTVASEGGTEYWKVSGLTGSGGESQEYSGEFTTIATVLNQAPSFTSMAESIASYDSSPTNVGSSVTFTAGAEDNNTDDWWLIVCKANSAPTHNGTSAPTCNGGTWCTASSAVNTGSSSICSYTVLQTDGGGQQQGNSETENWYAYTCDSVTGGDCSSSSQGTQADNSVSPFSVNHRPTFTSASVPSVDPGSTFTYTASYTEEDNSPSRDLVNLYVCESSGFTIGTGCSGTKICHSTNITGGNTLSCTDTAPSVHQDGTAIDYYAYMYDGHNLASDPSLKSGTSTTNNVSPTVSGVTLVIPDDSLTLTENSTAAESFTITGTITDNNNCHDVKTGGSAISYFYHASGTATGYSACDTIAEQDPDSCYPDISCILDPNSNTCSGVKATSTDATLDFLCTVSATIQYYANPTDANTPWSSDLWYATTKAIDDNSLTGNGETTTGRECDSLTALDISSSIDYLALTAGEQDSKCDITNLVTATGNVGLDAFLYGTDMSCDTGVTPQCTGAADIDQAKQRHSFTSNTDYTSGTVMQETGTDSPYTERELDCQKTYYDSSLQQGQKDTYWGIAIPSNQPSGTYKGTNTIEGTKSESIGIGMWNW